MLFYLGIFLIFFIVITIHELGHAWEMRKNGIEIARYSIGIPHPKVPSITLRRIIPGKELIISPILLGAAVVLSPKGTRELKTLSYEKTVAVMGGGIAGNILLAAITLTALNLYAYLFLGQSFSAIMIPLWIFALVFALKKRIIYCYFLPLVGLFFLGYILYGQWHGEEQFTGPIGIFNLATQFPGWYGKVILMAVISLGLGIMNCLPIYPLDGGWIFCAILRKYNLSKTEKYFQSVGKVILSALIIFIFYSDIRNLLK